MDLEESLEVCQKDKESEAVRTTRKCMTSKGTHLFEKLDLEYKQKEDIWGGLKMIRERLGGVSRERIYIPCS